MSFFKKRSVINSFLFPAPDPPSYGKTSFPGNLFFVPRDVDGEKTLPLLWIPNESGATHVLIHSHGNGCDVGQMVDWYEALGAALGVHVIAYEYDGYGPAAGSPSESSLNACIDDVVVFAIDGLGFGPERILFFGQSIGTGPTIRKAAEMCRAGSPPAGVITMSAYKSIKGILSSLGGLVAVASFITLDRFRSIDRVPRLTCPVLFIHGDADDLIACSHSEELYAECGSERKVLHLAAGATHNDWQFDLDVLAPAVAFADEHVFGPAGDLDQFNPEMPAEVVELTDGIVAAAIAYRDEHQDDEPPARGSRGILSTISGTISEASAGLTNSSAATVRGGVYPIEDI